MKQKNVESQFHYKKKTEKVEEFKDETSHTSEDGRILQLAAIA